MKPPMPTAASFLPLLASCRSLRSLQQLHAHLLLLSSSPSTPFPYNHFLSKLLPFTHTHHHHDYFLLLLASHPSPTAFTYNLAIRAFSSSRPHLSLSFLLLMLRSPSLLRPDHYTLPFALLAAARAPAPAAAHSSHSLLEKLGLRDHDHTRHSLLTMYACLGDSRAARRVFDGMAERDLVSWNAMVSGYARMGMAREAAGVFRRMVGEGWGPNGVTVVSVLAACGEAGDGGTGRWVEGWVRRAGVEVGPFVGSALVGMYEKCGEMAEARRVFDGIDGKDVVAWNAMITGQDKDPFNIFCSPTNVDSGREVPCPEKGFKDYILTSVVNGI